MSAIHKRCYAAMKDEFKLLSKVVSQYLPPEYPYDVVGGARNVKQADFDDRVDVIPVADPNIFSMSSKNYFSSNTITNSNIKSTSYTTCIKFIETCMKQLVLKM